MLLATFALLQQEQPQALVWEKLLAPGVTYRMEVTPTPLLIHAVRVTPQAEGVLLAGELASGKVFEPNSSTQGRETVGEMAARTNALVTVNADFFPYTGDPLGAMVRKGELISSPQTGRAVFYWGPRSSGAAYLSFSGSVSFEGQTQAIYGVNQECGENMLVLNTPAARLATSRQPATHAVFVFADKVAPTGEIRPKLRRIVENSTSVEINDDELVLTYRGAPKEKFTFLSAGDEATIKTTTSGIDWSKATDVIAGGPFLIREGKTFVPFAAEGFTAGFANNRHPRTAIGRTAQGDIWLVTVDGRQSASLGVSLGDLAIVMARLGCTDAINLDGGGSTTLNISNLTVNRPSEGSERAVANALIVLVPPNPLLALPVGEPGPVLAGPATIQVGQRADYRFVETNGEDVAHSEVVWSAQGAGWIDQAGVLRGVAEGSCQVSAVSGGRKATVTVQISKGS